MAYLQKQVLIFYFVLRIEAIVNRVGQEVQLA